MRLRDSKTFARVGWTLVALTLSLSLLRLYDKIATGHWLDAGSPAAASIGATYGTRFVSLLAVLSLVVLIALLVIVGSWVTRRRGK